MGTVRRAALAGLTVGVLAVTSSLAVLGATTGTTAGALGPLRVAPVVLRDPAVVITPGTNVPNPFILEVAGEYFMFSSQGDYFYSVNVPLLVSTSLTSWGSTILNPLPKLPKWAEPGYTWSPDVRALDGRYVMWFSAALVSKRANPTKCIGVATAASVIGPYVSTSAKPFVCQLNHFGSIDPRTFVDPQGRVWLLWKSDDNANQASTHTTIWTQQLSPDGLSLLGKPVKLMTNNRPWEGRIVEAPDMVFAGGRYWLFFSGNWFNQPAYAIGIAQCAGPTGPCKSSMRRPWLASNGQGSGPGEESVVYVSSRWWMLYAPFAEGYRARTFRPVALARLTFGPEGPAVVKPRTAAWRATDGPPYLPPGCASRLVLGEFSAVGPAPEQPRAGLPCPGPTVAPVPPSLDTNLTPRGTDRTAIGTRS